MLKNRNLFGGIADRVHQGDSENREQKTDEAKGPFSANLSGITNPRAPGQPDAKVQKTDIQRQLWVDPARCRLWDHHNRAYDLLNEERCADLIAGFRSLGRQQRPAVVRALKGEERVGADGQAHDYEIISGARRHWTVSWLRANEELNARGEPFFFLITVREDLSDTSAFELSDAENRGQKDISDFERAREYKWALESLYEGNVARMAEAIQMDRSVLTRLLALNDIPSPIVGAYPSILEIRTHHWRQLGPLFSARDREQKEAAERILECAHSIIEERQAASGQAPETGAKTLEALLKAAKEKKRGGDRNQLVASFKAEATGKVAVKVKRTTRGISLDVPRSSGATKDGIHAALRQAVDEFFES